MAGPEVCAQSQWQTSQIGRFVDSGQVALLTPRPTECAQPLAGDATDRGRAPGHRAEQGRSEAAEGQQHIAAIEAGNQRGLVVGQLGRRHLQMLHFEAGAIHPQQHQMRSRRLRPLSNGDQARAEIPPRLARSRPALAAASAAARPDGQEQGPCTTPPRRGRWHRPCGWYGAGAVRPAVRRRPGPALAPAGSSPVPGWALWGG